jgi:hypothetical protein
MWIPQWLYERLPAFYLALGGACLWFLGNSVIVAVSVLLLFAAALLTCVRRRSARQAVPTRANR